MVLSAPQHKRVASKCFQARLFEIRCWESHAQMVGTLPSTPHQGKNTVVVTARGNKQQMCCRQTNTSSSPITVPTQNPTRGTQQDSKVCCADSGSMLRSIPTANPRMGSTHSPLPTPNPTTQSISTLANKPWTQAFSQSPIRPGNPRSIRIPIRRTALSEPDVATNQRRSRLSSHRRVRPPSHA